MTKIEIEITWENNVSFKVTSKEGTEAVKTLIEMEENGEIATLWPAAKDLVVRYITAVMLRIGNEMKQP